MSCPTDCSNAQMENSMLEVRKYVLVSPSEVTPPLARLSDPDVQRIAEAVADELDRRARHPLRVTEADKRRWMR